MAWGKKTEKVVTFKEDKKTAKAIRDKAKTKLGEAGIDVSDTKKGVGREVAKTAKGQRAQQDREAINGHVRRGTIDYGAGKKGSKSEWQE